MELAYNKIEEQLANALPEIKSAAERYWRIEGRPGQDCGPYTFFGSVFTTYVEVLLAMQPSPRGDYLLGRAFAFVEEMLGSSDQEVANLAYVGLLEWRAPWWFARAERYMGPGARDNLDRFDPNWRLRPSAELLPTDEEKRKLADFYGVRAIIASELETEGVAPADIPGVTHTRA